MKNIILISGKAEHGKTTMAEMLKQELESKGFRVVITRYAYYLKDLATRYCGWDGQKDEKGRGLLQVLGTDIIRKKLNKPDFHVNRICEDIEICQDCIDYIIIDDVRFENELYYPKHKFGDIVISVRVNRLNEDYTPYESSLTEIQKKHPTETSLDKFIFDFMLNIRNIEEMREYVKNILSIIEK